MRVFGAFTDRLLDRFSKIGLREKLLFSMLAAIMFISVTIAFIARYILVDSLTNELEMRGRAMAHSVAERGGSYILDDDIPRLLSLIFDEAKLRQRKDLVSYIFIQDQDGVVLAHTLTRPMPDSLLANEIPYGEPDSVRLLSLDGRPVYDVAAAINEGLYRIGTVHVGLNKDHIDSLVGKLRVAFLGFISGVVILSVMLSSWLSRYISRPISDLTRLSDEISRGNFDIPLKVGQDKNWDSAQCPAFSNTDLPCWNFDQSRVEPTDEASEAEVEALRKCAHCAFYKKHEGDEVTLLSDSFRNMVWSIKLYRRRLRESEEKYRSLFDSGPDPVFVVDLESGTIRDANPRAVELYGHPKETLVGMDFESLGPDHNRECIDSFLHGGSGCVNFPRQLHYRAGEEPFFVNMHACPISYRGRHAIIVAATDVTELMEKDAQLIQAAKMKSLGEMSAGVAHEVNQPLNAIKIASEFLTVARETGMEVPEEKYAEITAEISAQVDRAAEIIDTLRAFGRKSALIEERVDLNEPVRAVLSMLRRQFELDDIRFDLDLQDDLPKALAHSNRLQQVIFNLVNNARDAVNDTPKDGRPRRIAIRTGVADAAVFVEVEDTGAGIAADDLDKVFEPFFTTKETGQGMGLGLAISYGIVKDYGGDVSIQSSPETGTAFRIQFPAATVQGGPSA